MSDAITTTAEPEKPDSAGVCFYPPMAAVLAMIVGGLLQTVAPLSLPLPPVLRYSLGLAFGLGGIWLMRHCTQNFRRHDNPVPPNKPIHELMTDGIYARSRNPMYVGLMSSYVGYGLLMGNGWVLLLGSVLFAYLQFSVINREETYLTRRFGQAYTDYQQRVRRWF
jgi:protein-S-isoprenylcysteine O-methyltransferase Ste14